MRAYRPMKKICPISGMPCRGEECAVFDDHWHCCSLHRESLSGTVRASVCDAAVEVIKAYDFAKGDDRK